MLVSEAGVPFAPPAAALVGLPDDWAWVCLYGALADVLANSPEGRDSQRAKYCMARYEQGKKAMMRLPWLLEATVGSVSVDTLGFKEIDTQMQNWEQNQPADDPQIVVGGIDLIALAPFATTEAVSTVLTVVENAPVPVADGDQIQLSRDGVDAVLAYAQHVGFIQNGRLQLRSDHAALRAVRGLLPNEKLPICRAWHVACATAHGRQPEQLRRS